MMVLYRSNDLIWALKALPDLFVQGNHVFFGAFQWGHNYSIANTMLYLRISQYFHNKPLFSETRTLPERHRHPGKDTEKESQPSKTYILGSLIQGLYFQSKSLYAFVAAAHSSSIEWWCQHCAWHLCPLPSRSQLESSLRVVTGCCSTLGGWPAPFPDPSQLPSCTSA